MSLCELCPRRCRVDREREKGACGAGREMIVGAVVIHRGEEPPLVKGEGSGAVFFSGCPLRCPYCQNYQISHEAIGRTVSPEDLSRHLLGFQDQGCSNINLVSPTHFTPWIIESLRLAKGQGLNLPVMINSSGYERVETLKLWEGHGDIYLMDIKYGDNETGKRLSSVPDYWDRCREAVSYLWERYGALRTDRDGRALSGLIVRHLVLPGMISNPFSVLEFISGLSPDIPVSIMAQYNPGFYRGDMPDMQRVLSHDEYEVVLDRAEHIGFTTVFIQDMESVVTYLPDFRSDEPFGDHKKVF